MLKFISIFCFISLTAVMQSSYSAITVSNANMAPTVKEKSPIEHALTHKQEHLGSSDNSLQIMTSLKTPPSQSILAAQNQSFSRFVQSLFSSNS